jgi:excisionase family DNA binding protein
MNPHLEAFDACQEGVPVRVTLSPLQAAQATSLSLRTIAYAISTGELRSFKKGRRRLIFREDLETYLRSSGEGQ